MKYNNNMNNLKYNLLTNSDIFNSNEKNYFINNRNINSSRNINEINSFNNFSFKANNNISNNLLPSTDTT